MPGKGPQPQPTPSPTDEYDWEQAARNAATTGPTGSTGQTKGPSGGTGKNSNNSKGGLTLPDGYTFEYETSQGYVVAVLAGNPQSTVQNAAFLADPKNTNAYLFGPEGTAISSAQAASDWLMRNTNSAKIASVRNLLISKGWLSGDAAKQSSVYGNIADRSLALALTNAISEISWRNVALKKSGSGILTLEEGLKQLVNVQQGRSGGGQGGPTKTIQRQTFSKDDYREAVDKAYMDARGSGASEQELSVFIKALQKLEAKNPQVTTQTTSGSTVTTKTTGGITSESATDLLNRQALSDPNAENYNKATKFMDYFLQAIESPVDFSAQ